MIISDKTKNHLLSAVIILCSWLLINWLKGAPDNVMEILLFPHKLITEIFYNIDLSYVEGIGYSSLGWAFAIGPECLGYNFILLLFAMSSCTFMKHFRGPFKILWIGVCFVGSTAVGIIISTMRIIASILFINNDKFILIHLAIGTFFYFLALSAAYMLIKFLLSKKVYLKKVRTSAL